LREHVRACDAQQSDDRDDHGRRTDGEQDIARPAVGDALRAKHRKAAAMRLAGHDIQIVSEPEPCAWSDDTTRSRCV